jgi:hypothetical protein
VYLFFLSKQSSHLGNWPKPNGLSNLISSYNDSLLILTILISILPFIITKESNRDSDTNSVKETKCLRLIMVTSLLWFSMPIIFWILSHLSSLNLFVDRYFIPKESALIFLVAYGLSFIFQKLTQRNLNNIPILGTFGLSLVLILISTKRAAFGLSKDTNYHHSLILVNSFPSSKQPIILEGDPKYFPNAYLRKNQYTFLIKNKQLENYYRKFSSKLKICDY